MKLVAHTESVAPRLGDEAAVKMISKSGFDGIDYSMFFMEEDDNALEKAVAVKAAAFVQLEPSALPVAVGIK